MAAGSSSASPSRWSHASPERSPASATASSSSALQSSRGHAQLSSWASPAEVAAEPDQGSRPGGLASTSSLGARA